MVGGVPSVGHLHRNLSPILRTTKEDLHPMFSSDPTFRTPWERVDKTSTGVIPPSTIFRNGFSETLCPTKVLRVHERKTRTSVQMDTTCSLNKDDKRRVQSLEGSGKNSTSINTLFSQSDSGFRSQMLVIESRRPGSGGTEARWRSTHVLVFKIFWLKTLTIPYPVRGMNRVVL